MLVVEYCCGYGCGFGGGCGFECFCETHVRLFVFFDGSRPCVVQGSSVCQTASVVVFKRLWRTIVKLTSEVLIRARVIDRGQRCVVQTSVLCVCPMFVCACVCVLRFWHSSCSSHIVKHKIGVGLA